MSASRALLAVVVALALAGCATSAAVPPGTVVTDSKTAQVQPGITTRAELLARLGPTTSIRFDSGTEVWRYLLPAGPGATASHGEYVVVLDARGIVTKTRSAPLVYQVPVQK
ncbi:hypothetical protein [Massilia sp. DWR3-1-1]|uniref:hypothetical protein n=1 Tax=Massilia sp. DWR3-1-1 TaxID=2804559 RepID=UPI003CEDF15A